jgi:hypothetical protein
MYVKSVVKQIRHSMVKETHPYATLKLRTTLINAVYRLFL